MFKEKYFDLKNKRSKFLIIMKNGIFYNVLGKDVYIMKSIFNYKVCVFCDTHTNCLLYSFGHKNI